MNESPVPENPPENLDPFEPKQTFVKRHRKKLILVLVALLLILIASGYLLVSRSQVKAPATESELSEETSGADDYLVRLVATGDMIPHDALNTQAKTGDTYDYFQFMDGMQQYFQVADVRFCNQAVLGGGEEFGIKGYPVFNSPTQFAKDMQKVGCNVVNTGTNHTNDLNQAVINASVSVWDDLDVLAVAGANRSSEERDMIDYFELEGVKFAFLSYTTYSNSTGETSYGLTRYSDELANKQIKQAQENSDIVLVSMRWGTEYSPSINASQNAISQKLADYGADIVVGHGPHVLEPVKKLKGNTGNTTYVWYSLGNFLNAQLETGALINGFAVMDIDKSTKKVASIGYLPVYMHYDWTPEQKAAQDLLARKNFEMYLLEESTDQLAKSQLDTTVEAQTKRITDTLNTYTKVPILTKQEYLN